MYQNYGIPELRKSVTEFYKTHYDVDLDPDSQVLPLMGSKEGIMHISMAYLNPGDEVLIPNPGYPTYASVTRLMQAKAITYDLKLSNDWQPDFGIRKFRYYKSKNHVAKLPSYANRS